VLSILKDLPGRALMRIKPLIAFFPQGFEESRMNSWRVFAEAAGLGRDVLDGRDRVLLEPHFLKLLERLEEAFFSGYEFHHDLASS
jgi:hypothetical protein